ncbi:proline--tRNA ligase [Candidatus Pacearchaeota archaeon]|nr:proline--tRNA ligase [Candidatus Pacearchaeota archaeon]
MTKEKAQEKNQLGVTSDKDDFGEWFSELMIKADLADYSEVSGCIVFKPSSYEIWEYIRQLVDIEIRKLGIRNCYFPLLIPEKFLNKEKEHIKGFSPEVAWVTHAGNSKLPERLAIRPTSETIMYPSYSKWIRSWRDLPLKLNQWNNVVRWEFSHPVPFFRTREFLWNEIHTALATEKEALEEGNELINLYDKICREHLALYGMIGKKTEREKFAGGVASTKIHYILQSGRVIEGPCFHYDGQNFAKAYDIKFLDKDGKEKYVYQNTYAITTRMLGTMFAIHADEKGLIIPPRLATNEIVIIPIFNEENKKKILSEAKEISKELKDYSPILDEREDQRPGFKFNEYELKGIPLRIEIGPKDLEKKEVTVARRDTLKKQQIKIKDLKKQVPIILEEIQKNLLEKSKKLFESKLEKTQSLEELKKIIEEKRVAIVPLCNNEKCEENLKFETKGAKAVFISEKDKIKTEKCIICNKPADYFVYAGKTY